jgi:hypothetical protein
MAQAQRRRRAAWLLRCRRQRHAELGDEPSREGTRRGVAERFGDASQRVAPALQVSKRELATHLAQQLRELRTTAIELALQRSHAQAEALRDLLHAGAAAGQSEVNGMPHFMHHRAGTGLGESLDEMLGMARHRRVGGRAARQ